ncbi:MAG TPA: S8 family serine peptidase [Trebonia sp.]|nr:S8 family serine peptidase [Trebonia sp.]
MTHYWGTKEKSGRGSRYWLTVAAVAAAVAGSGITAATATAATTTGVTHAAAASHPAAGTTLYAVGKRACTQTTRRGTATCDAYIRVEVPASQAAKDGAKPFKVGAGAVGKDTIGPAGGLTPEDLATAYGLNTAGGSGQTVGIVDAYNDPNINADLQAFDAQYGLPACSESNNCLRVVDQAGNAAPLPEDDTSGWSVEESLDVEAVHSVCHSCKIILVEANSNGNSDLGTSEDTAVRLGADEVSNSFGEPEGGSDASYQAAFNHPGTVITASAGDDGYYFFDHLDQTDEASIPAAYNTTVSVGGTSLYLDQNGHRQSESVWNDNGPRDYFEQAFERALGAGGGGCSTMFNARDWQTSLGVWNGTGCGSKRLDNDVSAVADYLTGFDVDDTYNCGDPCSPAPGWFTIGGTSLSSPIIAAAFALAGGAHGFNYPALTLYGHRSQAYDVTHGGNGWCDGQGASQCPNPNGYGYGVVDCAYTAEGAVAVGDRACDALGGYDGPTGVGTPDGIAMFDKTGPSVAIAGPGTVTEGKKAELKAAVTDPFPGGFADHFEWHWGDGTSSATTTDSASHTYKTGGASHTITLTVTDNYGGAGSATHEVKVDK